MSTVSFPSPMANAADATANIAPKAGKFKAFWIKIGKGFKTFGNWLAYVARKIYEFVKPLFVKIGRFFAKAFDKVKQFVVAHKKETIIGFVALLLGMVIYGVAHAICCKGGSKKTNDGISNSESKKTNKKTVEDTEEDSTAEASHESEEESEEEEVDPTAKNQPEQPKEEVAVNQ